eukprot:TRINITY_DN23014_c0_g1_i1.p1 TRINITY_DN23014_c0_g1~~TRINITY_DN23014_c0_g1_i1.p1  ORF type:complete len:584 (+),score=84.20 TRINITY_DN23014_c0_g1_i1:27-1778(+)
MHPSSAMARSAIALAIALCPSAFIGLAAESNSDAVCAEGSKNGECASRPANKIQKEHLLLQYKTFPTALNGTQHEAKLGCCGDCSGFCSPRSGKCYDKMWREYYIRCAVARVDPEFSTLKWEGWGVSLAWWANVMGQSDALADACFTMNDSVMIGNESVPSLGMTVVRYNLGASSWNTVDGRHHMRISFNTPRFKQIEGFWQDWYSEDPNSSSWNWQAAANQVSMLHKAKGRGVEYYELFSNAPMWWMTKGHNPAGAWHHGNCLMSHNHEKFAKYLAITARRFLDHHGIRFTSLEPFNEPTSGFWGAFGTQEGCGFDARLQAWVLGYLKKQLRRVGLENLTIAASDENKYREAIATWKTFAKARMPEHTPGGARALVGQVNVHAYGVDMKGTSWHREALRDAIGGGRKIWMSEYGEHDGSGWLLATNLHLDFRWLRPSAWCIWQLVDETGGWGLIRARLQDQPEIEEVNVKYWVFAHYSRHIRPGMSIISCGNDWCIAAYSAESRRLVLVQRSEEYASMMITYDLSRFGVINGPVTHWYTDIHGSARYSKGQDVQIVGKSLFLNATAKSIHTIEIEGVDADFD